MVIESEEIVLREVEERDRDQLFDWAVNSDATYWWFGDHVGEPIPSYKEFFEDFDDAYFDKNDKDYGWFIIETAGKQVGMINYQREEEKDDCKVMEFDILIANENHTGKGIGSKAYRLLIDYLSDKGWKEFMVETLVTNERAKKSFLKAGFIYEKDHSDENGISWSAFRLKIQE